MKKKRIVSLLLAMALLFTMDTGSIYASGIKWDEGQQKEVQQNIVRFDLNGGVTAEGESSFSLQVQTGTPVDAGAVASVQKSGYLFQGWKDNEGYYNFDRPVLRDMILYASWTPISYRIQFDLNGGEGETPPERLVTYDEEVTLPAEGIYKPDHVLAGWKQKNVGTYQEGMPVKNLASREGAVVVLKAVWRRGEYKVRFHANGGTGKMEDEVYYCGKSKKLTKNTYTRAGYTFVGWNTKKNGKGESYQQKEEVSFSNRKDGSTVVLYAMWKGNPYKVKYVGNGAQRGKVSTSSHVYGTKSKLRANKFKRKGYKFVGWNTKENGKGKTYKAGAKVKTLTEKKGETVTLYAKWKMEKYTIRYYTKNGKLPKGAKKSYNVKTKTFSLPSPTRKGYDFDGWYKDAKCKKRISDVKKGSAGNIKVYAKWVKCTRQPDIKCAKVTFCKGTAKGKIKVRATVKKRVASPDDLYYLIQVDPISGQPYRMAKKAYKTKKLRFTLDTAENEGYAAALFGIAVKKDGKYHLISNTSYVKNPEKAANNQSKYKPGKTKKGIQLDQFDHALEELIDCDAKNTFINLTVYDVCANPTVPYVYNGKTYYFSNMGFYPWFVSECNKRGINVTAQILLNWVDGQADLIDPSARVAGAAPYYTWNIREKAPREKMEAIFSYMGMLFGREDCYVSNWILGNEINNPRSWNYAGGMSEYDYFHAYAYTFRSLYYGVRSHYSNARVFICMDNYWNSTTGGRYSVKHSISAFEQHLRGIQKGINWNLAYHAYSMPLTYTNFWEGHGITYDSNSPAITMRNLDVLTDYIKQQYGSSIRVILSEQGYGSDLGQQNQAAAIAASYYIAACNPMVDAFIIRSYYDHPAEVAQGIAMGIAGKEAFDVYKYMDTKNTSRYTDRYLGLIGISNWGQLVPRYNKKWLYTMYQK